jgi:hypothetical protein
MEIFYQCYGAEAGLAGLKWLPYGGLYLTGAHLSCLRDTTHSIIIAIRIVMRLSLYIHVMIFIPYCISGGLTPRSIDHLTNPEGVFLKSFHNKVCSSNQSNTHMSINVIDCCTVLHCYVLHCTVLHGYGTL